ncbi:hypothetical protein F511_26452 [Dorcoceras hygrometricum]|uniref:Retrotransposon gag domain-containing protein n=1 Tax=Dorcoceras hygrometricum TaxID=472368 RepID=A0A2Z7CLS6_9LAMI|nr:hypothetical protein F511_26452 [Dorcoceras hygrometricum]
MDGLFDRVLYDTDQRLSLATFQFREHAQRWWKGASMVMREMDVVIREKYSKPCFNKSISRSPTTMPRNES